MVKNNTTLFIISGLLSFFFFLFLLGICIFMAFINIKKPIYALKKENYVSVSIDFIQTVQKKEKVVKKKLEDIVLPKVDKVIPLASKDDIEISDLFNNVWTKDIKKITKKKESENNRRLDELTKKIKTLKQKSAPKVADLIDANISKVSKKISTGTEVNEYLSKINAIVYKYFNPPQNTQGNSVKARIDLSAMGTLLDFTILNYSSNQYLNEECDKIKDRLKSVIFPSNPNNKTSVTIVILTSKE